VSVCGTAFRRNRPDQSLSHPLPAAKSSCRRGPSEEFQGEFSRIELIHKFEDFRKLPILCNAFQAQRHIIAMLMPAAIHANLLAMPTITLLRGSSRLQPVHPLA
jgi:hypothetical protein